MDEISSKAKLRIEFIGMAFALAIGQVGLEIGEFYSHHLSISDHIPVLGQLVLGTYIITSSWVGWQKSKSEGHLEPIDNTFGKPFLIILVDLFLVICYFIIVKSVEKPYENSFQSAISSSPETRWSLIIFITYAVWDILTKLFKFDSSEFLFEFSWKAYLKRAYQAWICIILIAVLWFAKSECETAKSVLFADIYLLLVFILFRGMKEQIVDVTKHKMVVRFKYLLYISLPIIGIVFYFFNKIFKLI